MTNTSPDITPLQVGRRTKLHYPFKEIALGKHFVVMVADTDAPNAHVLRYRLSGLASYYKRTRGLGFSTAITGHKWDSVTVKRIA